VIHFLAYVGGVTVAAWTVSLVGLGIGAGVYAGWARLVEWRHCRRVGANLADDLARFEATDDDDDALIAQLQAALDADLERFDRAVAQGDAPQVVAEIEAFLRGAS
jgi:hypothetical protein